jgi:hypothetical protein
MTHLRDNPMNFVERTMKLMKGDESQHLLARNLGAPHTLNCPTGRRHFSLSTASEGPRLPPKPTFTTTQPQPQTCPNLQGESMRTFPCLYTRTALPCRTPEQQLLHASVRGKERRADKNLTAAPTGRKKKTRSPLSPPSHPHKSSRTKTEPKQSSRTASKTARSTRPHGASKRQSSSKSSTPA